jgi:hypothetical protein
MLVVQVPLRELTTTIQTPSHRWGESLKACRTTAPLMSRQASCASCIQPLRASRLIHHRRSHLPRRPIFILLRSLAIVYPLAPRVKRSDRLSREQVQMFRHLSKAAASAAAASWQACMVSDREANPPQICGACFASHGDSHGRLGVLANPGDFGPKWSNRTPCVTS